MKNVCYPQLISQAQLSLLSINTPLNNGFTGQYFEFHGETSFSRRERKEVSTRWESRRYNFTWWLVILQFAFDKNILNMHKIVHDVELQSCGQATGNCINSDPVAVACCGLAVERQRVPCSAAAVNFSFSLTYIRPRPTANTGWLRPCTSQQISTLIRNVCYC